MVLHCAIVSQTSSAIGKLVLMLGQCDELAGVGVAELR